MPEFFTWTWLTGSDGRGVVPNHGIINTPHPDNTPGGRRDPATWTGDDGHLYLFGGSRFTSGNVEQYYADTWRFNVSDRLWTWINGSTTPNTIPSGSPPSILFLGLSMILIHINGAQE